MSIEALIKQQIEAQVALTDALNRNSDLLEGLTEKAGKAVAPRTADEALEKAAAAKTETKTPARKSPTKPAKAPAKPAKPKAITAAELGAYAKDFIAIEDSKEYAKRRELIKDLADYYNVSRLTEAEPDMFQEIKDRIQLYLDNKDPFNDLEGSEDQNDDGQGDDDGI